MKEMPTMPGSSQLSIAITGKSKAKAKAQAKSAGRSTADKDDPVTPKLPKKRKGDDELMLIDLKRQQIVIKNNLVAELI